MSLTQPHVEGAKVMLWTPIDERHRATDACRHYHDGKVAGSALWLAICRFDESDTWYLFRYHADINRYSDTFHESVEDAKNQAEFEYEGVNSTWVEAKEAETG